MSGTTKTPISVYTMMMILSTIFMFFACLFMGIEYFGRYGGGSGQAAPKRVQIMENWDEHPYV